MLKQILNFLRLQNYDKSNSWLRPCRLQVTSYLITTQYKGDVTQHHFLLKERGIVIHKTFS